MTDTVWPLTCQPRSMEFYIQTLTAVFTNPYTRVQQVLERAGQRWVCRMEIERGDPVASEIDALLASIRGPAGTVLVPDFRRLWARGDPGSAQLTGGAGRSLTVTGLAGQLLPGDLVQTSTGRMHIVTAAAGPGSATVAIEPPLRETVTVGALVTDAVRCRMRLQTDDAGRNPTRAPRFSRYSLAFAEVLDE